MIKKNVMSKVCDELEHIVLERKRSRAVSLQGFNPKNIFNTAKMEASILRSLASIINCVRCLTDIY